MEEDYPPAISDELSVYMMEQKREAQQVLVPEPLEIAKRIALVTVLRGKHPDLYQTYRAIFQEKLLIAIESLPINPNALREFYQDPELDIGNFLKTHAPSIGGRRSEQIVRIAQTAEQQARSRGFWSRLFGR